MTEKSKLKKQTRIVMVKYLSRYSLVLSWTYLAYWKMHYSKTLSLVYLYNKQYHIWLLVHMKLLFECST